MDFQAALVSGFTMGLLEELFTRFSLTTFYLICFGLGLGYALITFFVGGFQDFDADGGGVDADGGADVHGGVESGADAATGAVHFSPFSPISMATFITSFGGIGIIGLHAMQIGPVPSALVAVVGALLLSVGAYTLFYRFFILSQGSSVVSTSSLIGRGAEIITPIGPDVPGEIAYVAKGARQTSTARSLDNSPISKGVPVIIRKISGHVMYVEIEKPEAPGQE